jgi:hypothetical protein
MTEKLRGKQVHVDAAKHTGGLTSQPHTLRRNNPQAVHSNSPLGGQEVGDRQPAGGQGATGREAHSWLCLDVLNFVMFLFCLSKS